MTNTRLSVWPLVIPPIAWSAQGLAGWFISSRACSPLPHNISLSLARTLVACVSALALFAIAAAVVHAVRRSHAAAHDAPTASTTERNHFLFLIGVVVSSTLSLGLVWATLPTLMVSTCGQLR